MADNRGIWIAVTALVAGLILHPRAAPGEEYVFALKHGGRVVGELMNPGQVPRETYVVRTARGIEVTLQRSQVQQHVYRRPEKVQYQRIHPGYPDTVGGQWELAEWCRQRHLDAERERHLERILELDENHQQARRALGYGRIDGKWKTQEQFMKENGYVWYDRKWRLPQEVKLAERDKNRKGVEGEWSKKINQWRKWLDSDKAGLAAENVRSIDDGYAVKALSEALKAEPNEQQRMLFVEALARAGTPAAMKVLAVWSLADPVEEVGLTCIDHLRERGSQDAIDFYIQELRSTDNTRINRAASALEHMGNPVAIPVLMDVLVTAHKFKFSQGNPGQMSTSFSTGGGSPGGLSVGGRTMVVTRELQNRAVLEALVTLSGGKNFGFDIAKWKSWYAYEHQSQGLDARRN